MHSMYQAAPLFAAAFACPAATANAAPQAWKAGPAICNDGPSRNSTHPLAKRQGLTREANPTIATLRARFAAIKALADGWDGPASVAPDRAALSRAARVLDHALSPLRHLEAPFIVPAADGGIQAEWYAPGHRFEMYFDSDGDVSAWSENRATGVETEEDGDEAFNLLIAWTAARDDERREAA